MHIWVDADACPGEIKELLFRAAKRTKTKVTLVANQPLRTPRSEFVDSLLVSGRHERGRPAHCGVGPARRSRDHG